MCVCDDVMVLLILMFVVCVVLLKSVYFENDVEFVVDDVFEILCVMFE